MADATRNRCGLCGRKLVHAEDAYGPGDPRIDCGGDCLACMWSVEMEAGEHRARRPDEFQLGMGDDRVWVGMDEDPRPLFSLSRHDVKLLTGQSRGDHEHAMLELLALDKRMREWLKPAEEGKIG